jgi:hypothetical protein
MTDLEKRAITALQGVRFPREGWYENRARFLEMKMVLGPHARLVVTQAGDLWYMVWKFRRQIGDRAVVAHADELINGAMHLAFDGSEESLQREGR